MNKMTHDYCIEIKDTILDRKLTDDDFLFNFEGHKIKVSLKNYNNDIIWNFNDGTITSEREPLHYYELPGLYNISASFYILESGKLVLKTATTSILVKEIVPTELSFLDKDKIKEKLPISKINKLSKLQITLGSNIISEPKVSAIRVFENEFKANLEKNYFEIKDIPRYHLEKYYTFLENIDSYNKDKNFISNFLSPTNSFTPVYNKLYARLTSDENNKIKPEFYILNNEELIEYNFSYYNDKDGNRNNANLKIISDLDNMPSNCYEVGKIAHVNIWYKNDFIGSENNLIFKIDKKTLKIKNESSLNESYLNIPPLGLTVNMEFPNEEENILFPALTLNGIYSKNNTKRISNKIICEDHFIHSFYKNYETRGYFAYFIENDNSDKNNKSFSLLKDDNILKNKEIKTNNTDYIVITNVKKDEEKNKEFYKYYSFKPLKPNFSLYLENTNDNTSTVFYTNEELIDYKQLILPSEKISNIDVNKILDTYMQHPLFEGKTNLKNILLDIFKNIIPYITTKSSSFLDDKVNYKTCYIDDLDAIFKMLDINIKEFSLNSFNKINEFKDLLRIISMNYSNIFGNYILDNHDISITHTTKGKNVGKKIDINEDIWCDENYNIIGIGTDNNGNIKENYTDDAIPFLIVKDNYTSKTFCISFNKNIFKNQNIKKIKLIDYDISWGWPLNLPSELFGSTGQYKKNIFENYYSFYLFKKSNDYIRKYNFIADTTIPKSKESPEKQITVEEWEKDFGFVYDCIIKLLISKLIDNK